MARVLIAGCGDVGIALGRKLAMKGHRVWGLRRNPEALPATIHPIAADLTRPASLVHLPADLDAVVFAAAAPERSDAAYRATYVDGLANVIARLDADGQRLDRILFTSSTGVYHQDDGRWVDEDSETAPTSFTGQRMLEAEGILANAPWPSIAVRFGGIYGPGRTRLIERARRGETAGAGMGRYTNRIHVDDCAGALRHLIDLPAPSATYVAVDDAPSLLPEVVDFICHHQDWPTPPATVIAPATFTGKRCRNQRLRASGFTLQYPTFREGYAAVLDTVSADQTRIEK